MKLKIKAAAPPCKRNAVKRKHIHPPTGGNFTGCAADLFTSGMERQRNETTSSAFVKTTADWQARLLGISEDVKKTFGFE